MAIKVDKIWESNQTTVPVFEKIYRVTITDDDEQSDLLPLVKIMLDKVLAYIDETAQIQLAFWKDGFEGPDALAVEIDRFEMDYCSKGEMTAERVLSTLEDRIRIGYVLFLFDQLIFNMEVTVVNLA
jgi:hypothetical protein